MQMTDTDRLATPTDLAVTLKRLTTILREAEALPSAAQQRFWDDLHMPAGVFASARTLASARPRCSTTSFRRCADRGSPSY